MERILGRVRHIFTLSCLHFEIGSRKLIWLREVGFREKASDQFHLFDRPLGSFFDIKKCCHVEQKIETALQDQNSFLDFF